jgi:ABC-type nitrate/sulfonate/bicarbonate transport system permease component
VSLTSLRRVPPQVFTWLGLLVAWWLTTQPLFGGEPIADPAIVPRPLDVISSLVSLLSEQDLVVDLTRTIVRLLTALAIAIGVGIPLGLIFGLESRLYAYVEGVIHALRSVPGAALFPLALLIVGIGETSIITLATYNSLMVIIIHTVSGTLVANERRLQQAKALGAGSWSLATEVLFWEALPHVLSGVRVAAGYTLALIIAVEMFIGNTPSGLGRKIFDFQAAYRTPEVYATIALTAAVGVGVNLALTLLERRLLRWVPNARSEGLA